MGTWLFMIDENWWWSSEVVGMYQSTVYGSEDLKQSRWARRQRQFLSGGNKQKRYLLDVQCTRDDYHGGAIQYVGQDGCFNDDLSLNRATKPSKHKKQSKHSLPAPIIFDWPQQNTLFKSLSCAWILERFRKVTNLRWRTKTEWCRRLVNSLQVNYMFLIIRTRPRQLEVWRERCHVFLDTLGDVVVSRAS